MVDEEKNIDAAEVWRLLETVSDPEIPVLSVIDLGIVRDVKVTNDKINIAITPTYSGCPAMDMIAMNIRMVMVEHGYKNLNIEAVLSPPWTTDWMTDTGKKKLAAYGIAPPHHSKTNAEEQAVICPQCGSGDTKLLSQFGSTSCKALYQCNDCKEPFDHFKCH